MKKYFGIIVFLFFSGVVYSQSADVITDILNSPEVNYGQVCYLAAIKQGLISESASYDEAIEVLFENNQIFENAEKDAPVVYVNLAFIFSSLFKIKGGIMFKLTRGSPRYAFRQMQYDGVIPEEARPATIASGPETLSLFTACINKYEGVNLSEIDMED